VTFPAVFAVTNDGKPPVRFEKEATYHRLSGFLGKVALRKPVLAKPAPKEEL